MHKSAPLLLSCLTGILLMLAWPVLPFTFLIFIAWVPFFYMADLVKKTKRFFIITYVAMSIWNIGTTWWIWNSTAAGAIGAILANSLLMCLPLTGYYIFKNNYGQKAGALALIFFWLSFEYLHLNWQLSWPWLTLGNVFATHTDWVQWYEYTGVSGGTFWVLIVNVLVYYVLRSNERKVKQLGAFALVLFISIPFLISFIIKPNVLLAGQNNIVIVQPNIDPYNVKFAENSAPAQIAKLIELSEKSLDTNTRLVLWPETAVPVAVWQDQVLENTYFQPVLAFVKRHPKVTLLTGIETLKNYGTTKETKTARKDESSGIYYDMFNAAISIKAGSPIQFYNKSKLVPGVETLPDFLLWLGAIFEQFGGTAGGYGHDDEARAFKEINNPYITAPIICYESIYGEYVTSYVRKGANLLTIMTNDGWWGNTAGHKQHLAYARLRAVETRKWLVRSANTGISAVINNVGEVIETRIWDEASAIKSTIPTNDSLTFYVNNGPIIFRISVFMMLILLVYHFVLMIKRGLLNRKV